MAHKIAVGTLVETHTGAQLFVVYQETRHGIDLYWLSHDPADTQKRDARFTNPEWVGGLPEGALRVVNLEYAKL